MTKPQDSQQQAEPQKKRRLRCFILLLIPVFLLSAVSFLILGMPHRWQVDPVISRQDTARMQRIIQKLTSSMVTEDGKIAETAEIELSPAEINTLLTFGLRAAQLRQQHDLYYDAEWKQGFLFLRISRILPVFALNLEAGLVPSINNGRAELKTRFCRIGRLSINRELADKALLEMIRKHADDSTIRMILRIVDQLTIKDDSICLRFRPQNINLLFPLLLNAAGGKR